MIPCIADNLQTRIYGSGSLKDINRYSTPPVVSRMELERLTPLTPWSFSGHNSGPQQYNSAG
jgi:hypothetical protein